MDKLNIHEGNKIIADFMGYEYVPFNNTDGIKPGWWKKNITPQQRSFGYAHQYKGGMGLYLGRHHTCLKYHTSWDALMKVFIKFRLMDVAYEITSKGIRIYDHLDFDGEWSVFSEYDEEKHTVHGNIIHDAWRAAICYIKYYNCQKSKEI